MKSSSQTAVHPLTPSPAGAGRRRVVWVCYAALSWSLFYGLLGLYWALGGAGFPFGVGDRNAQADGGSLLVGVTAQAGGAMIAVAGFAGVVVSFAMTRPIRGRLPSRTFLLFAWSVSAGLLLAIPDLRLLQNFAYLFVFYTGKIDWPVLNQVWCVVGGALWVMAALSFQRRVRGACQRCGRNEKSSRDWFIVWGRRAAYISAIAALPYPAYRLVGAAGIPLGFTDPAGEDPTTLALMMAMLALLGIGGAVLTLGLVHRWGEVFSRWIPFLSGRRVPILLAVVPGFWAAVILTVAGRTFAYDLLATGGGAHPTWEIVVVTISWTIWGVALGVAVLAYSIRRRAWCRQCGRG
ncbi:hypothetical protein [Actinomadura sp. 3N407]|uniref:hypothetical protein n=1 Tax=Actinomadura sp. 3N407 TaxID=3457423 RepID=UPI003FCC9935